jgi:hypothetical protein
MTARDHIRVSPPAAPSSRPAPGLSAVFARRQTWIPAFAGMTVEGVWRRRVGVVSDMGDGMIDDRSRPRLCRPFDAPVIPAGGRFVGGLRRATKVDPRLRGDDGGGGVAQAGGGGVGHGRRNDR